MNISISEQHLEHIRRKVKSGHYASSDAVIAKALDLLDQHDEALTRELEEDDALVREGVAALCAGDYTDYADDTLNELFEDVKRRGRERHTESPR